MVTSGRLSVNKPSYYRGRYADLVETSGVDWSEVHAVRLLGVALAALILLWAIRRMFGGRK